MYILLNKLLSAQICWQGGNDETGKEDKNSRTSENSSDDSSDKDSNNNENTALQTICEFTGCVVNDFECVKDNNIKDGIRAVFKENNTGEDAQFFKLEGSKAGLGGLKLYFFVGNDDKVHIAYSDEKNNGTITYHIIDNMADRISLIALKFYKQYNRNFTEKIEYENNENNENNVKFPQAFDNYKPRLWHVDRTENEQTCREYFCIDVENETIYTCKVDYKEGNLDLSMVDWDWEPHDLSRVDEIELDGDSLSTINNPVVVNDYIDHTIGFDNWTVCTDQNAVDGLARKEEDNLVAAFGTIKADGDNSEKNKSTKLSEMCGQDGGEVTAFELNEVTIPERVRSVIVGNLKESPTTFKFENSESKAPTVKVVENTRNKKVVVKIPVATLTLPPNVNTTLDIQEGGSIKNLECDPTKVFVMREGGPKSLNELFQESKSSFVNLGNGITLKKTQDNEKKKNKFNFEIIRQQQSTK